MAAGGVGPRIDLTGGRPLARGHGRLVVELRVPAAPRSVQAVQQAILVITGPGGAEVRDENGDPAVYSATVSGGAATILLPGLPPTTPLVAGQLSGPSAGAYVLNVLIGQWSGFVAPGSYADLATGALAYGTETAPGVTFKLDSRRSISSAHSLVR